MEKNAFAHAQPINALFALVFAVVYPFDGEGVAECLDRVRERHTVVTPVRGGFGIVPIKNIVLHEGTDYQ